MSFGGYLNRVTTTACYSYKHSTGWLLSTYSLKSPLCYSSASSLLSGDVLLTGGEFTLSYLLHLTRNYL